MSTTGNSRADGRAVDELRPVTITRGFTGESGRLCVDFYGEYLAL